MINEDVVFTRGEMLSEKLESSFTRSVKRSESLSLITRDSPSSYRLDKQVQPSSTEDEVTLKSKTARDDGSAEKAKSRRSIFALWERVKLL